MRNGRTEEGKSHYYSVCLCNMAMVRTLLAELSAHIPSTCLHNYITLNCDKFMENTFWCHILRTFVISRNVNSTSMLQTRARSMLEYGDAANNEQNEWRFGAHHLFVTIDQID